MPMQLSGGFGSEPDIPAVDVDVVPEIPSVQAMVAQAKESDMAAKAKGQLDWGEDLAAIQQLAGPVLAIMGIPAGAAIGAAGIMSKTGTKTSANTGGG